MLGHSQGGNLVGAFEHRRMSKVTFDEAGSVAQFPKELGENVTRMLGGNQMSTVCQPF